MPKVNGAPEALNKILESTYASALKEYKGNKEKASKAAWAAAEKDGWKKGKDGKWSKAKKEMSEEQIEIDAFKVGDYPQGSFQDKELSEVTSTYNPAVYEAPILIGHLSDPAYKGKTTVPAFGWIGKALKTVDGHLKLITSQFSDQLKEFIKQGLYKKVSAAFFDPNDPSNPTPGKWHLHHLAFLGAAPPQVKGLEGIAFSISGSPGVEFSEFDATVVDNGNEITAITDPAEEAGTEDTIKDMAESCATCMAKIEEALTGDIDADMQRQRAMLAISDLNAELTDCAQGHFAFIDKLENIEEHAETELAEKKGKFKQLIIELAQKFTNNNSKDEDMDKELEAKLTKENEDLKKQVKEFSDAKIAAEAKAAQETEKTADAALRATVKEFCEKNKLNTKRHEEMKIQDILFAVAKANQTIEFAGKDKDGKDILEKKPVLEVLQNALKNFQLATPAEGEMTEFNEKVERVEPAEGSIRVKAAKDYVKSHPAEFSDCQTMEQKVSKALQAEINHQITFTTIK